MDKWLYLVTLLDFICLLPFSSSQPNFAALLGLSGLGDFSGSQVTGSGSCPYQPHPDPTKFSQVVNNRLLTQDCAPGTMFDISKCSCDNIPSGGIGGRPMPGSNPRLESAMRGGSNPMLQTLMSQLQGGGSSMMSGPNMRVPQVTSGIRPDQKPADVAINVQKSRPSPGSGIQYNPDQGTTGLTSVVDPSVLPDVLPPEILKLVQRGNSPSSQSNQPSPSSRSKQAPPPVIPQLPDSSGSGSAQTQDLPPDVQKMLERAMRPPSPRGGGKGSKPSAGNQPKPSQKSPTNQRVQSSGIRIPSPSPQNQINDVMRSLSRGPEPPTAVDPRSSPREDPLAALLAGLRAPPGMATRTPPRGPQRGPSHSSQRRQPTSNSIPTGGLTGGDPLAALLSGLTRGGSGSPSFGSAGGSPFGGSGGADLSALLAGLGGGAGSPSAAGGPLDVNSLQGNLNVATLLGETPGPSLGPNMDMTSFFNEQGRLGIGGGLAALSGINTANLARLQQLDRQGVLDLSDLTPAGLAAANAHFG